MIGWPRFKLKKKKSSRIRRFLKAKQKAKAEQLYAAFKKMESKGKVDSIYRFLDIYFKATTDN